MRKYDMNVTVIGSSESFTRTYRVFAHDTDDARQKVWKIAGHDAFASREFWGTGAREVSVTNRMESGREHWVRNRGASVVKGIADVEIRTRVYRVGTDPWVFDNAGFVVANDGRTVTVRPHRTVNGRHTTGPDQVLTWPEFLDAWSVSVGVYI